MHKITLLSGMLLYGIFAHACDVCGCAASSFSLGLLPSSNHHFIGLRSGFRTFTTTHPPLFGVQDPPSSQLFVTTELYGRWKISRKFQLLGMVPYVQNQEQSAEKSLNIRGLGDITILVNFVFVQTTDSLTRHWKQVGTVGLGVKSPTGKFDRTNAANAIDDPLIGRNMYPGTGAFDFIANLNYSLQRSSWGYLTESSFSYKSANKSEYQFGHALSTTHLAFYRWNINENLKFLPQAGFNYNHNLSDRIAGKPTDLSYNGGTLLNAQLSIALIYKNWAFTATGQIPLYQQLGNGYVEQKTAFRFGINYFITRHT
jgi:hypothetical protein